ncbi:MAG TPA: hypothetical protein PL012_17840 [Candidatus Obscuribacter sp.]|nr:hypothetical protein [Candidatus Obscuribacter sp.]
MSQVASFSHIFSDFQSARRALLSGASFAIVDAMPGDSHGNLNWAMSEILPFKPYAALSSMLDFRPETLEGKAIFLAHRFLRPARGLLSFLEKEVLQLIRNLVLQCSKVLALDDSMHIRAAEDEPGVVNVAQRFHTDGRPAGNGGDYFIALVTLGAAPGTELACPGAGTLATLARLSAQYNQVVALKRKLGFFGTLLSQPELIEIAQRCDEAVLESEIVRASPYQVVFMRNSDCGTLGAPGACWHRAPRAYGRHRGLLVLSGALV